MPLQSSGAISIQNIATEFGGTVPHSLSEYYRSGGLVPNVSANNNIPTSGQISMSQFYNATVVAVPSLGFNGQTFYFKGFGYSSSLTLRFMSNGIAEIYGSDDTRVQANMWVGNWYSPTTPGIGASHWVRFTVNNTFGLSDPAISEYWSPTSAPTSLFPATGAAGTTITFSTDMELQGDRTVTYTAEIATNSAMTNLISSTVVTLRLSHNIM